VIANKLADEYAAVGKTIEELSEFSSCEHSDALVAPVGGTPVPQGELIELDRKIRTKLSEFGYPKESLSQISQFDYEVGKLLFEEMDITLGEAARNDVWSFLGCVMMPDCVAWRFSPRKGKDGIAKRNPERFKGGMRNTFQRLWWRARVLYDESQDDKFHLTKLPEDALVQIMERPNMMADWKLSRGIAHKVAELLDQKEHARSNPEDIWRDASKRIRQRSPFTNFLLLDETELDLFVKGCFEKSIEILSS
jgi:hypothetical protein